MSLKTTLSRLLVCCVFCLSVMDVAAQNSADIWDVTKDMAKDTWSSVMWSSRTPDDKLATDIELYKDAEPSETFVEVWEKLLPRLDETLTLGDQQSTLPESAWFGPDQSSIQSEVDVLLDEAITILGITDADIFREHIRKLQEIIAEKRQTISQYRREKVTAPRDSTWKTTVEDYEEDIAELQDDIKAHEEEMVKIRTQFADHLKKIGLNLNEEQLEFLLSTVVGEDIVQMGIAFDNVKLMTGQLEKLVEDSSEELSTARRYYGMYTVLLRVLDRMYGHLLSRIDQSYLPKIESIVTRTRELKRETEQLLKQYPERSAVLRGNLSSQELTLKASELYKGYLTEQRADVVSAKKRLNDDILIANNTYDTVKVSGELIDIVKNSRHLLETLGKMQIPALRGFENLEMKREFQRLTIQIRENQPLE